MQSTSISYIHIKTNSFVKCVMAYTVQATQFIKNRKLYKNDFCSLHPGLE